MRSWQKSLEKNIGLEGDDDDEYTLKSIVSDKSLLPDEEAEISERRRVLKDLLEKLPAREKLILELRFGFFDGEPRTLDEVGKMAEGNLSRERIRQIEARALIKLRRYGRNIRGIK